MPDVEILAVDGTTARLSTDPAVVRAGPAVLSIRDSRSRRVRLDGVSHMLSNGHPGLLAVDLTRSTAFHRLEVDSESYWFATEDSKLRLDGVARLLHDLGGDGTSWSGQLMFSDGSLLRDPHVVFAWLDHHADAIVAAGREIVSRPTRNQTTSRRLQRHAGHGVDVSRTLALLRSRPREYLVEREGGLVAIDDRHYDPLRVVAKSKEQSLSTLWNHRFVEVIDLVASLVDEVLDGPAASTAVALRCQAWRNDLRALGGDPTSQLIRRDRPPQSVLSAEPSIPEQTQRPYAAMAAAARDLHHSLGWSARSRPLARYSYVAYADEIYQAWAATVLARALGLERTGRQLGATQPAFVSEEFSLFYDSVTINAFLRSWRHSSNSPDALRPDVVIHSKRDGRVVVLDVKYRKLGDRATEDSRKEVLAYMASFGLAAVGIIFPPATDHAREIVVQGHGRRLVEIPLRPGLPTDEAMLGASLRRMLAWSQF